jgi:hypothetical protein
MTLDLFEPPQAVSFQRPANNKKRKVSASGGRDSRGDLFLLLLLGKQKKKIIYNDVLFFIFVHFCLPKKGSRSLVPLTAECPEFIPP